MTDTLRILYQDDHLIAIDKPAGLLVHRSAIDRYARVFAMQLLRDQIGRHVYPVHRLDRPTAGVLLFALDTDTARRMGMIFEARSTHKIYTALVRGYAPEQLCIDYPLKEEAERMTDRRAQPDKAAQSAITDIERTAIFELPISDGRHPSSRYSLIHACPRSGRKHQIRRHLKHIFHPIVGDTTHGDGRHNRLFRERFGCQRLLLTAQALRFSHPHSGTPISIETELDPGFKDLLQQLSRLSMV